MTSSSQILNWLTIGFEQPTGSLTEKFYYDKRDREFFSMMAFDYFMLDEEMNMANNISTNYSKSQENSLVDRMKRIEKNDPNIISIPRVTLDDRKLFMQQFLDTLSDQKLIDILNHQIQSQDYKSKFDFNFNNEADEFTKQKWEATKTNFLHQRVDTFLNLNNINVANTTLWIVDSESSISMDFTNDKKTEPVPLIKKRWWKFW